MERSPELEQRVRDFGRRVDAGDSEAIVDLCSRHECVSGFGTDDEENWQGYGELTRTWVAQRDQVADLGERAGFTREIQDVRGWTERGFGWVTLRSKVSRSDGRVIFTRSTFVFRLERGEWKAVHVHSSSGVPNEELWGQRTLTSIDLMTSAHDDEPSWVHPVAGPDGTATIVFTDIEDSTRLNERLGDDGWMKVLRDHNQIVRRHVTAEKGLEVKHQGDGFMLAFSDPNAALRSAVAIQRSLAAPSEGERIRVRIGAHMGPTVVEADDFFGQTVAMAARIAGAARGGEILVSDGVRTRLSAEAIDFDHSLDLELKGFPGRHAVHRINWEAA